MGWDEEEKSMERERRGRDIGLKRVVGRGRRAHRQRGCCCCADPSPRNGQMPYSAGATGQAFDGKLEYRVCRIIYRCETN